MNIFQLLLQTQVMLLPNFLFGSLPYNVNGELAYVVCVNVCVCVCGEKMCLSSPI